MTGTIENERSCYYSPARNSNMNTTATAAPVSMRLMRGTLRILTSISPGAASRVAMEIFRTPRRFRAPQRELDLLANAEQFDVQLGAHQRIRAWRWGKGPSVFLAHGWEGRGSQMAVFAQPLVDAGHSVITWDAPGHGASDGSRSSLPEFAWALRGLVDRLGTPKAIVAHSLGCAATTLAFSDGLAIDRAVFVSPPLEPLDYTLQFGEMLGLAEPVIDGMRRRVEQRFLRPWSDFSLSSNAPRMTTPLLVVHDRDDMETRYEYGVRLADLWPGATLVTTSGLGHRRILRDSEVVSAVTQFVKA
jgi:pimeloyl-ACP methyl ester carboxylesterase